MTTVFISYSHDSPEHAERVRGLTASLARDGCDCRLDVHKDTDEDWPAWMTRQLIEADFVLCVVTETYERRLRDQELPDVGRGVGWEASLIRRLLYAKKLHNERIFPVLFDLSDRQHIPLELQGYDEFVLDDPSGYESLLRKVLGSPLHTKPETGKPPELPSYPTEPLFARPGIPTEDEPASDGTPSTHIAVSELEQHPPTTGVECATRGGGVTLIIEEDHASFNRKKEEALRLILAEFIGTETKSVRILLTRPSNSTRVCIQLGEKETKTLLERYARDASKLRKHGIRNISAEVRTHDRTTEVALRRLPVSSFPIIARESELAQLDAALSNEHLGIVSIVAWGGVGKTALVSEWLARLARRGFPKLDAVFDWSFYSQGTRQQAGATTDAFLQAALHFFGDREPTADSPWDRGTRLAQLVGRSGRRNLLVLDGLEPLQHPRGMLAGRIKDAALTTLLHGLARHNDGLCVITTRVSVADLTDYTSERVRELKLENLSEEAGVQILRILGVRGSDADLACASREVDGHALTLQLMGRYLVAVMEGDIRRRDVFKLGPVDCKDRRMETEADTPYGHTHNVMGAYEKWLANAGKGGRSELAVLQVLGLFDRPADVDCLAALRAKPAIPGLTEPLVGLEPAEWNIATGHLAKLGLILPLAEAPGQTSVPPVIDAHPLLREYFGSRLRHEHKAAWTEGHRRLFEHLCATTEHQPATLEGLQPLYDAVAHGCLAGLYERALHEVYVDRILRGTGDDGFYSWKKLGTVGADLGAVACFFEPPWRRLSPSLSPADQAWLLNEAATRLRALGRLIEAAEPMRASLDMDVEKREWKGAATSASNLSELELTLGQVSAAVTSGAQSVDFADRSGVPYIRMVNRTKQADALHQAGIREAARERFAEAERLQAERQPEYPWLYSVQGFRYCDVLLSEAERAAWQQHLNLKSQIPNSKWIRVCDDVSERATQTLEWVTSQNWLLDIALDHLTLGRAGLCRALLSQSEILNQKSQIQTHLTAAVDGLRQSGAMHHLPRGLLSRAWFRFLMDDRAGCEADLAEVQEIAERGPMPLFLVDGHLTRARLFRDRDALKQAEELLKELQAQGYHRRDDELADALEAATTWG